jgi:hypothetical protein
MLSVTCKQFMLSVVLLSVVMLNVIMLSVVMLSFVVPYAHARTYQFLAVVVQLLAG